MQSTAPISDDPSPSGQAVEPPGAGPGGSRFLAAATHELRQPLHALSLHGDALRRKFQGTEHEPDMDILVACIASVNESLDAMLDVSMLDAGVVESRARPVALAEVFARIHARFNERAAAKGIDLRFRHAGARVIADPDLLQRLLGHLVDNALKYTPEGGVLVAARPREGGSAVAIEIRDAGPGIPESQQRRVFEEYFQIVSHEGSRTAGLGLGLTIARRLADLMGLALTLRSAPGRGSTFALRCAAPAAHEEVPAPPRQASAPAAQLAGARILVVDNDHDITRAVSLILKFNGAHCRVANSFGAALDAARREGPFDAAVLDYHLDAGRRGTELAEQLEAAQGRALGTMIVSGETDAAGLRETGDPDVPVYFKPLRAADLVEAVGKLLARKA